MPDQKMERDSNSNLYILARRAWECKDYQIAEEYYSSILLNDPNDWEATFYSALAEARVSAGKYWYGASGKLYKAHKPVYALIKKSFQDTDSQHEKLSEVVSQINLFVDDYYGNTRVKESYHVNDGTRDTFYLLWGCGDCIESTFGGDKAFDDLTLAVWKRGEKVALELLKYVQDNPHNYNVRLPEGNKEAFVAKIRQYADKIKEKEPSYNVQIKPVKQGCYVATCVYGSYDCLEVWTLRRYRDDVLATTYRGKLFIKFYYAVSPTIVKLFGRQEWFHKIFKKKLDRKVGKLRSRGVECTPYKDREW